MNRDRAICVRLMGGLGNQMFQYAVGRATAHRLGVELLVDDRYLQRRQQHSGFALDAFRLRGRTADAAVHSAFPEIKWRVSRALRRQIRAVMTDQVDSLPPGLWVVRLRTPFAKDQFVSAASDALRDAARTELQQLFQRAVQPLPARRPA